MDSSARSLEDLVSAFRSATLPRDEWTHAAHLRVGVWHVLTYGDAAFEQLREDIRRLNEAHGTPNTDTSGYHETITWLFVRLITHLRDQHPPDISAARLADLAVELLSDRSMPGRYYSPARLASSEARGRVVAPDRDPLPG